MTVVCLILGFVIGISLGSSAVVVALGGSRNAVFWSLVQRHPIVGHLAKLWTASLVTLCGVMFAYLGYSLVA
jgi:hypothetical protein